MRTGKQAKQPLRFTLVELLVVIAVISILMTLMLPALNSARDIAKGIACCSNLKQQGFATASYANDYNGYLLSTTYWDDTNVERWKQYIAPYLVSNPAWGIKWTNKGVFKCPSWTWSVKNINGDVAYDGGYAWDYCIGRNYDNTGTGRRRRLENLTKLSQTILIGDCINAPDTVSGTANAFYCAIIQPPFAFSFDSSSPKHRAGWNNLWADFHVNWQTRIFLLKGVFADTANDPPIYNAGDFYYYPHSK